MKAWLSLTALLCAACPLPATSAAAGIAPQDVLQHLNQTIAWYQHANSIEHPPDTAQTLLIEETIREDSRRAVQLAFSFAKAEAALLGNAAGSSIGAAAPSSNLQRAASTANERVKTLESQIDAVNQLIQRDSGKRRATLVLQRDALNAFLNLAKQSQAAIDNMIAFSTAGANTGSGLLAEINQLANSNSIPSALNPNETEAARSFNSQSSQREFAGLVVLLSETLDLTRSRMQVDSSMKETNTLLAEIDKLRTPLRTALRAAINQGESLVSASDAQKNPAQVQNAGKQIEQLATQFKALTTVVTPLAEQAVVLQQTRVGLQDWRNAISQQYNQTLRYAAIRSGLIALAIVLILMMARLWHKAIHRYVKEQRRRRQFMLLRRLVIAFAIVVVAALGFFTTFTSVATFIGFLTAGLALALQNVILSVVAYFFLIGRYGLRVGDRVTVSGVTGQVIEIGLVRFFLMELTGSGADLHPTGRVAAWANSMIFQPYSWLKQAPGAEYLWHAVSVTVAAEIDYELARSRLTAAVDSVYESYRESIEQQHAAFEQSISVQTSPPKPVSRIHFTEAGCEIFIRYPVDVEHVSDIDRRIVQAILEEVEKEPKLTLGTGGVPKVQTLR